MNWKKCLLQLAVAVLAASSLMGAPFGRAVAIGGHAADIALDEGRGVLYVANFTANRIDVMSLSDNTIQRSINVAAQPSALAISPDGQYLVVVHFGNFAAPASPRNSLTVINLNSEARQTFALGSAPIGVAFGIDNRALIVTTSEFVLFDPTNGTSSTLDTVSGVVAKTLPQPPATFPTTIKAAALGVSGDGLSIYGFGEGITFKYDVTQRRVIPGGYQSSVPIGPRSVSVNQDGSRHIVGWLMIDNSGAFVSYFDDRAGLLDVGGTAFDSARGLVYAQIPPGGYNAQTSTPILKVVDSDNLALREELILPENMAGKAIVSSDGNTMYAASDSGVLVLPVGQLELAPRVTTVEKDLVFRGNFCDRTVGTQTLTIVDRSGANTPFSLSTTTAGIRFTPSSGVTPATVRVTVDPNTFANNKGTTTATVTINAPRAVNPSQTVRLLINSREPDQRGTTFNVPGRLVDVLADPIRERFYVIRQDTNEVLVFDNNTYTQIASMRTANVPTQGAITFDRRYLLVANQSANIANMYDLETLQPAGYIRFDGQPQTIAASANAILANVIDAEGKGHIQRVDLASRTGIQYASLGVYSNEDIPRDSYMVASPNGNSIFIASGNGQVMLYSAVQDTFTISRKDSAALNGPVAASAFDQYAVGNFILNQSLVRVRTLETGTGTSSGFAFVDQTGLRLTAPNASSPGVIQRVNLQTGEGIRPTRTVEAPVLPATRTPFTRTLAPLANRNAIIALTQGGFTVLPWAYDTAVASPRIERVVNAADNTQPIAPNGLITVFGENLSPISQSASAGSLPTSLSESCLQVNGLSIPVLFVSPRQINAQLPVVEGNVTMRLATPGGISDNFNLTVLPNAPSIFRVNLVGDDDPRPAVVRAANGVVVTPSNPVRRGDTLVIYATGLGRTSPDVTPGEPAPGEPPVSVTVPPVVTIGGVPVEVTFAGLAPGQIGVYQINVVVNQQVPTGLSIPLAISQGTGSTSFTVRVVN
jgi:uncharacterized protein (TIGR03437 family)